MLQNSTKLEFFNTFKNDYTPSSYLGLTNKLSERKELVKLRIGNHKLRIETGRVSQMAVVFYHSVIHSLGFFISFMI